MEIDEYKTNDIQEATYLAYKGFEYATNTLDTSTQFVFSGDVRLFRSLIQEFHDGSKEYKLLEMSRTIKKVALGGRYTPNFYKKKNV